jgi:hypothetical protein
MSQLFSRTACKRSISPAKGAKRLLDPGRKRVEGIEAGIEGLLARVGVVGVVGDWFNVSALHPAETTALLRAAFIID